MLLNRCLSWRQRGRPQLFDPPQNLGEQVSGDGHLCELECEVAAMSHDLSANFDQFGAQSGHGAGAGPRCCESCDRRGASS